jgi:hypothetical protein
MSLDESTKNIAHFRPKSTIIVQLSPKNGNEMVFSLSVGYQITVLMVFLVVSPLITVEAPHTLHLEAGGG